MADSTITGLTAAATITGAEVLPVDQSASTVKVTVANLAPGLPAVVGDAGSGGTKGMVPAPAAGDSAGGKFLKASGAWAVPPTGGTANGAVYSGRLTLTTGVPVTTSDVTGATTIYFTPYKGAAIDLFDGASTWTTISYAETSLALGTLAAAFQAYDVFAYNNSGTLALESLEWLNATVTMTIASPCVVTWAGSAFANGNTVVLTTSGALPTGLSANTRYYVVGVSGTTFNLAATPGGTAINTSGTQSGTHTGHSPTARNTALVLQNGVLVKSGATTRRYLGTFMSTATTTTEDSAGGVTTNVGGKRYLWNHHHRLRRPLSVIDTTASWAYTTDTWRQARATAGNLVEFVIGLNEELVTADLICVASGGTNGSTWARVAIGLDNITTPNSKTWGHSYAGSTTFDFTIPAFYREYPGIGYHYLAWLERGAAGTCNFQGQTANAEQSGMQAVIAA